MGKLGGGVLGLEHLKKSYSDNITEDDFTAPVKKSKVDKTSEVKEVPVKEKTKKVKAKTIETTEDSSARVTARISEDFDNAISMYCIENDMKRVDLAKEALIRVVGLDGSPAPLKGDNCKVVVTRDDKCKVLSFRVSEDFKRAIRKYVYEARRVDPDVSENYVLAQAIADFIGYKKKMRFN